MTLLITISVAIAIVIALAVREIVLFVRKRESYQLRRLTLRLLNAALLAFLLAAILVGIRVFHLDKPAGLAYLWLSFWGSICLLLGAVFFLLIADFRMTNDASRVDANRMWGEIARTIAEYDQRPK